MFHNVNEGDFCIKGSSHMESKISQGISVLMKINRDNDLSNFLHGAPPFRNLCLEFPAWG
jgi:hypothetical protein